MALLDPVALLVFFGAIAVAYGVGRLIRTLRRRRKPAPAAPLTRAERRRRNRRRR
jgi:hypothetical protein